MTSRNYCVTLWSEPIQDEWDYSLIRYAIVGARELCPSTGKEHWHAYIECSSPVRFSAIKKMVKDPKIKIIPKSEYSTRDQARAYAIKEGTSFEYGTWIKGQGHRSDLIAIVEELKEGVPLSTIMLEDPNKYCQYRNGLRDIASHVTKLKTSSFRHVEVILLTGPTGTGKTKLAMENSQYKIQGHQLSWWQDYEQEETICIDEYSNNIKITELLSILDGYQYRLPIKGSHTYANWTKVYITTNLKIDELHEDARETHRQALFRRITKIVSFWETNECHEESVTKSPLGNTD